MRLHYKGTDNSYLRTQVLLHFSMRGLNKGVCVEETYLKVKTNGA